MTMTSRTAGLLIGLGSLGMAGASLAAEAPSLAELHAAAHALQSKPELVTVGTIDDDGFPQTRVMSNLRNPAHLAAKFVPENDYVTYAVTRSDTEKLKHLAKNPNMSMYYQSGGEGLLLMGRGEIVTDRATYRAVWDDSFRQLGYSGPDDAMLVVLRFTPSHAKFYYQRTQHKLTMSQAGNGPNRASNATPTDHAAINDLIVAERMYRSSHRNEELAKCYADDAQIRTSWQSGGVSTFVGMSSGEVVEQLPIVNRCGGALIHQNGNRAFVEYPTTTTRGVYVNSVEAVLTSYMRLLYRVEKRDGEWKITAMTSINESDELAAATPGQNLKIKPKDLRGLRLSYRWLAYTRLNAGGTISQDLPGTDRPAEVKKIYDGEFTWLNQ